MKLELHNEVFHNLYLSPDIIRMIKQKRITWAGMAACMDGVRNAHKKDLNAD
jgi:hypothetical protein